MLPNLFINKSLLLNNPPTSFFSLKIFFVLF
ncbi:hypothetical protein [Proteus phage RP7]|nr:hypothetical protein [Proteus phage RP7]